MALNALHLGNDASSSSFLLRPTKVSAAPFLKHRPSAFAAVLARPQFDASGVSNARMQTAWPSQAMTVTDRYKQNVYDTNENKIRDIKDVLVDKSGKVVAPIDGVGGFLGAGEKDVAVPFETVHPTMKGKSWWQVIKPRKTVSKAPPVSNCLEHDVAVPDRP